MSKFVANARFAKFANDIKTTWLDKKLVESIAKHSTCNNNIHLPSLMQCT
jgi:hypothetical protein